ncbi:hypothetical protein BVG16_16275 [Paenibacillus selenitireducens]|uniref:Uncharacterized protein n=1 Tax=Paenibacillus selenitireducens TaxID=1324314 RepID=A0A1T2XAK1_9BACL|nr:hypothetical protein [Paenibacillus selenitireducens]OPA76726.1 hypothetical protein BVG16_16275 [Paenibacillus selenitireducens]
MLKFEDLNARNSTILTIEGEEYRTTQDPHISDDGETYQAHALNTDNEEFLITWDITNNETTDESEACDWDSPIGIMAI